MRAFAAAFLSLAVALPPVACHRKSQAAPKDALANARALALDYLASLYSPDHLFDDPYLTCEGQAKACSPAFRELDHAVLVEFWLPERVRDDPRLAQVDRHSRHVLDGWLDRWNDRPLDRSAIDLYALFPYYYPGESTRHMLSEVLRGMSDEGDWEPYTAHPLPYRKVTDELWTVLALVRNHVADRTVQIALRRKREEAARILHGDFAGWSTTQKFYGLSHIALLFLITAEAGYDVAPYLPVLDEVEDWMAAAIDDASIAASTAVVAEDLDILSLGGYPNRAPLARMAQLLLDRQEPSGRWRVAISEGPSDSPRPPGFGAAHATLITLAALEAWAQEDTSVEARFQRRWRMLSGPPPSPVAAGATPPPVDYATVSGRRAAVGFPITAPREIQFIDETRANWENSVLFFRASVLRQDIDKLTADPSERAVSERGRDRALLEIVEQAAAFRRSPSGIRAEQDGRTVTLRVTMEFEGPGATPALAARAASAIEEAWRGTSTDAAVVTSVSARVRRPTEVQSEGALEVFVPIGGGSPYTKRAGDRGEIPTTWPAQLGSAAIAHEMGHFFGFADEYHVELRNGFYYVVYDNPDRIMSCPLGRVTPEELEVLQHAYLDR
jgi:hypothetical protein